MYAWGWNSLENSAETVQLCLRMRSQKNTSFTFLHETLKNTSWVPCFEAENFNLPGWHYVFRNGKVCTPVEREHLNITRPWGAWEEERETHTWLQRIYKVDGGGLKFAGQRKKDNGLKKATETEGRQEELKGRRRNKVRRWHGHRLKTSELQVLERGFFVC